MDGPHGSAQRPRIEIHSALRDASIEHALIGGLFARRAHARAMLARATPWRILGEDIRVLDAADLIGLKVQSSSNDPARRHRDLADVERLLRSAEVDLVRVREYFRLFDREKELDALLAGEPER